MTGKLAKSSQARTKNSETNRGDRREVMSKQNGEKLSGRKPDIRFR